MLWLPLEGEMFGTCWMQKNFISHKANNIPWGLIRAMLNLCQLILMQCVIMTACIIDVHIGKLRVMPYYMNKYLLKKLGT